MKTSTPQICILALGLSGLSLLAPPNAQAVSTIVDIGGMKYDVTYTDPKISYSGNQSLFNTQANGGKMPWWGNSELAKEFTRKTGQSLGYPNGLLSGWGPLFAYSANNEVGTWSEIFLGNLYAREALSNKVAQNGWARVVLGVNSF